MPNVYTVKARRSRTLWQDAETEITEAELAAKRAELGWPNDDSNLKLALEAIVDDREFDLTWETDDAETNDIQVTRVNGERVDA